jgi:uncharacterized protein
MTSYRSPGVYRQDVFVKPQGRLPTGVPGFVGFAAGAGLDEAGQERPAVNQPVALHRKEEFADTFRAVAGSALPDVVAGFFDNGGTRCYVVRADPDPARDRRAMLIEALAGLGPLTDLDLVAVPDAMGLPPADAAQVQKQALDHCRQHGDRMAILDSLKEATTEGVLAQRNALTVGQAEPVNGALYYPWLKVPSEPDPLAPASLPTRLVPPCGHVAGVFSRTDGRVGVFKAPANEEVLGVLDLEAAVDGAVQDVLNPEGINCLRAFPGRSIRVWGARTLSRQPEWRYVNVRRLFLTLGRWIDLNMAWAAFEPNTLRLWVRINRELTTYLTGLWRDGALLGAVPAEAFYVKCDAETNPPESREAGQVVTEIGLAPSAPAEFVVVRIVHREANPAAG